MREKLIELLKSGGVRDFPFNAALADHLIANGVTMEAYDCHWATETAFKNGYKQGVKDATKWISVKDRLPEPETEVMVLAERRCYSFKEKGVTTHHIVTTGMYEDGTKNTEDSNWWWETDGFEYDEELDAFIIPEGWWEYKHYNGDEDHNYTIDDTVTHWMPLPEPPKGE